MNMRYFWTIDKQNDGTLNKQYHPSKENIGNCVTKYHPPSTHQKSRPLYIYMPNSPIYLQSSLQPHVMQGYVNTSISNPNPGLDPSTNPRHSANPRISINMI